MIPGTRLGTYEIQDKLGAGDMGEVYRARDTKLGRAVAIKVLPPDFAADEDRLVRFEREARTLAALGHANTATIFGLEESGSTQFVPDGERFLHLECERCGDPAADHGGAELATRGVERVG